MIISSWRLATTTVPSCDSPLNAGLIGVTPHVTNRVDLTLSNQSIEIGMRIQSDIHNSSGRFFTDANGLHTVERPAFGRNGSAAQNEHDGGNGLPVQGHFFPATSYSFIQDQKQRLTVLSRQPQGVASLRNGESAHDVYTVLCVCRLLQEFKKY